MDPLPNDLEKIIENVPGCGDFVECEISHVRRAVVEACVFVMSLRGEYRSHMESILRGMMEKHRGN